MSNDLSTKENLTMANEPENKSGAEVGQSMAITPMQMLSVAVSQNADLDKLQKLMELQERWEANEARKAFNIALGAFKAEGITIDKDARVIYKTSSGATDYRHSTLGNICNVLGPALSGHGLSYRWATEQIDGRIKVTCVLSHEMGHSASVSLEGGADTSGGKNSIQAIGSTVSYLQRYTLLAITGTATAEQDDDGMSSGNENFERMDESQLADYLAALEAAGTKGEVAKVYLKAIEVASGIKDQQAMDSLNDAKSKAIERIEGKA